jgi:hypothetical protein
MRKQISSTGRRELLRAIAERYKTGKARRGGRLSSMSSWPSLATIANMPSACSGQRRLWLLPCAVRACVSMTRPSARPWSFSGRHKTGFAASDRSH